MAEVQAQMQSPWVVYYKELAELFAPDPDVRAQLGEEDLVLRVYVHGEDKAESISAILPDVAKFGNVEIPIEVIPDNDCELTFIDHLRRAFAGNPALVDVVECPTVPGGPTMAYALFAPEVAQVEVDNAGSPYGLMTTTYEGLARDVLEIEGVMISSEVLDD